MNDKPFILMMTGPSLSLKSVVSAKLSIYLHASLLDSTCFATYPAGLIRAANVRVGPKGTEDHVKGIMEPVRKRRHDSMAMLLPFYLILGVDVILDSAFTFLKDRQKFYKIMEPFVEEHAKYEIILLYCHAHNPDTLRWRFDYKQDGFSNERNLTNFNGLKKIREEYQPPLLAEKPATIISLDTDKYDINITKNPGSLTARKIVHFIRESIATGTF